MKQSWRSDRSRTITRRTPKAHPQFGLIAEEVAKVNAALVLPDKDGKPLTVRYDQVNAMLLNEFLKEHRKVERPGSERRTSAKADAQNKKRLPRACKK